MSSTPSDRENRRIPRRERVVVDRRRVESRELPISGPADDPDAARRRPESVFLETHRPDPRRPRFPRDRLGRPRHGDSDRSPGAEYTVDAFSTDVTRVLDQIARPVAIVGASMGGLTGIQVAHQAGPAQVSALVLVDVVPRFEKDGGARIRDFMFKHVHGFDTLDEAADAIAAYLPHRRRPGNLDGLKKNLRQRNGRWFWHWDPAFLTVPTDDAFVRVERIEQAAIDLTIPILLIRGQLSDVVSVEGVEDFLAKVPGAEFVELSDAGHTAAGDDNDAFSESVVDFLTRCLTPRRVRQVL